MNTPQVGDVWRDEAGEFRITRIEGDDVIGVIEGGFTVQGSLKWFENNVAYTLVERDGKQVRS